MYGKTIPKGVVRWKSMCWKVSARPSARLPLKSNLSVVPTGRLKALGRPRSLQCSPGCYFGCPSFWYSLRSLQPWSTQHWRLGWILSCLSWFSSQTDLARCHQSRQLRHLRGPHLLQCCQVLSGCRRNTCASQRHRTRHSSLISPYGFGPRLRPKAINILIIRENQRKWISFFNLDFWIKRQKKHTTALYR